MTQTARRTQTAPAAKPPGRTAATLGAVGLVVALTGLAVYVVGRKVLAPPDLAEPGTWERWFVSVGPVVAVFAVGRVLLLAVSALWVFTAVSLACASLGGPGRRVALLMVGLLRRLHLPGSARMIALTVGLSVSAVTLGACGAAESPSSASPPAPVLVNPAAGPVSTVRSPATTVASPTPRVLPTPSSAAPTGTPTSVAAPTGTPTSASPANPAASPSPASAPGGLWVVRPGDDLWSIAAQTIQLRLGRQPDRAEIAAYWLEVIAANHNGLPRPDDPSLLYPGDLIELPAS